MATNSTAIKSDLPEAIHSELKVKPADSLVAGGLVLVADDHRTRKTHISTTRPNNSLNWGEWRNYGIIIT